MTKIICYGVALIIVIIYSFYTNFSFSTNMLVVVVLGIIADIVAGKIDAQ